MQIIRNDDLEPAWTVKQAKEPGFLRSLITWVGGPEGYINTNPRQAARSLDATLGLMRMPVGNRQAGVHVHSVTEIYVILKGQVESFDGVGNVHRAGPLDCLYIPKGVPHGVRTVGDVDLELIWFHDAIERNGVSVYLDGDGPFPAEDEVRLIAHRDLEPDWNGRRAKEGGTLRWTSNWVAALAGGINHNPSVAVCNESVAAGVTAILPGNSSVMHRHGFAETYVVLSGSATVHSGDEVAHLGRLDAARFDAGEDHRIRNLGEGVLQVFYLHEMPKE